MAWMPERAGRGLPLARLLMVISSLSPLFLLWALRGASIELDEAWYLKQYEDIALAVAEGSINSARQHFVDDGYFEAAPRKDAMCPKPAPFICGSSAPPTT
jgi:hypothetical protein